MIESSDGTAATERSGANAVHWHNQRRKDILRAHPEVQHLNGHEPLSGIYIAGIVFAQFALAVAASFLPLWAALLMVATVGIPIAHALGVAIHECAHDLVFERPSQNKWLAILANMPLGFPGAIDFRVKHLVHHRKLGAPDDTQAPTASEIGFTRLSPWRKLAWLCIGPLMVHGQPNQDSRRARGWMLVNFLTCFPLVPLFFLWNSSAFSYLALSALCAFGAHPVGIRRYAEHFMPNPRQPTTSYYGLWSPLAFHVGMHVEHHDFPHVPWTRLPKLHAMASEFYDRLDSVDSWTRLWLQFVLQRGHGLDRYPGRYGLLDPLRTGTAPGPVPHDPPSSDRMHPA